MYPTSQTPPFFGGGCKRVGQHKLTFFFSFIDFTVLLCVSFSFKLENLNGYKGLQLSYTPNHNIQGL